MAATVVVLVRTGKKWRWRFLKILGGFLIILGLWWGWQQLSGARRPAKVNVEPKEVEQIEVDQGGFKVTTGDGWVEGASTNDEVVTTRDEERGYPIYSEPNSTSWIMYYAKEGSEFAVLEERADWYRVVLPDSTGGWLAKTSVKQTTVEAR